MPTLIVFGLDAAYAEGTVLVIGDDVEDACRYMEETGYTVAHPGDEFYAKHRALNTVFTSENWPESGWDWAHSYYNTGALKQFIDNIGKEQPDLAPYFELLDWDGASDDWHRTEIYPHKLQEQFSKVLGLDNDVYFIENQVPVDDSEVRRGVIHDYYREQ